MEKIMALDGERIMPPAVMLLLEYMQKTLSHILAALIFATFIALVLISCGQKNDWTQLTSFRIYDYKTFPQDKDINSFSDNDIQEINFIETDLVEAKMILSKAKPLGNKIYLWKGHHFAIAKFANGQVRRIKISVYGGFFKDLTGKRYYEFRGKAREDWDKFCTENYTSLYKQTEIVPSESNAKEQ
jgi:hypothetical protein